MVSHGDQPLSTLVGDHDPVTIAINRGIREALLTHARLGNSVSGMIDGKLITLTPEEIFALFGKEVNPATNNLDESAQ